jgi:hypothetical protein
MTARRLIRLTSLLLVAAAAMATGACASTRTVNQLLADPGRYRNDTVKLSGEVVDSYSVANRGVYLIDDGTGRLWIVSEKGVPRRTARVEVKGKVREGFNIGSLADALKLPPGIAAGLVLLESSHKAKR